MPKEKATPERINVFFSDEALARLKSESQKRGLPVSTFVRMIVMEYLDAQAKK